MSTATVDPIWKDRIERALKSVSRTIDLRQRADAIPILTDIANRYNDHLRRPVLISEPVKSEKKSPMYTDCSIEELTGEQLICPLTILPQIDHLPNMFTYVSLQRNFLCDTMTNLSDLILEQDDEDVKNLLISIQSDSLAEQQQTIRTNSITSKRIRRFSKTSFFNDRNNEYIFDDEHFVELLKRLKQQSFVLTSEDESHLFDALLQLYPSSADLIRDRFGTIFESKRLPPKEFTPNLDNPQFALDTTAENTLHSYFMLFCRRCYRYDCFLHKDKPVTPDLTYLPKKNPDVNHRPCQVQCFRTKNPQKKLELKRSHSELIRNNGFHSKRLKSEQICSTLTSNGFYLKSTLKRQLNDELSHWLPSEKSLFRIFYTIFGDNICMIAHILDKPCLQVYTFYLHEKQTYLQKEFLLDVKVNGNGNHNHCSSRRSHSSSFRRQRSYQQILLSHQNSLLEQKRHTYYPCDHESSMPCNENCFCVRSGNFCEKYCCCSSNKCDNRFPGCRCRSTCTTKQCPCYAAARECDPDLCTSCGANDFHNENNHEVKTKTSCSCHNVAIQRSLHKPLLLAESDVAGWGIFTQVNIQRNEFIAEYCGEILTQDEGELRGRTYDRIGTSFLFDLNEEYMVDATYRGNKIRFANHSINPNCYAKVIMVNGDHRIGIYSKRFISTGEELFFDYRYGANHHLKFVGVEKNTDADHVDGLPL